MPTQPRDITYPIQLTTAELAFLLTLVHATTLQGGDDRALFPAAETERDALWLQGREQLIADGWLVREPDREVYAINDQLLLLIAALAAPEVVLLTERKTATATFGVAHYIALESVIELVMQAGTYELIALVDQSTMALRLAHSFGLAAKSPPNAVVSLTRQDAAHAKRQPDAGWLVSRGIQPAAAQLFAHTMQNIAQSGTISVLRTVLGEAVTMRLVGIVVAPDGVGWWAVPVNEERLQYTSCNDNEFALHLVALIDELRALPIAASLPA